MVANLGTNQNDLSAWQLRTRGQEYSQYGIIAGQPGPLSPPPVSHLIENLPSGDWHQRSSHSPRSYSGQCEWLPRMDLAGKNRHSRHLAGCVGHHRYKQIRVLRAAAAAHLCHRRHCVRAQPSASKAWAPQAGIATVGTLRCPRPRGGSRSIAFNIHNGLLIPSGLLHPYHRPACL